MKSSCSILSQQIASDRSPMLVTPWHPLTLSSRRAVVCLAMHHSPTSVTCVGVGRTTTVFNDLLVCLSLRCVFHTLEVELC